MDNGQKALFEKIGRQEIIIEGLKNQMASLSSLLSKFVSGEEKPEDWEVNAQGQLAKKQNGSVKKSSSKRRIT